jgi:hypothetical protein
MCALAIIPVLIEYRIVYGEQLSYLQNVGLDLADIGAYLMSEKRRNKETNTTCIIYTIIYIDITNVRVCR